MMTRSPCHAIKHADDAGADGEQRALGERETNEPRAAGAEPHANRELAAARPCARQQEVGDVRARDEQERADRGEQDLDRPQLTRREKVLRAHRASANRILR